MYQEHYGLERPPFKITPDTSLFFEGSKRGAALEALVYAIRSGEGIIKVVGEVGSGKTMLCRMLEMRLNDVVDVVYIANPSLSPDNILHVIAHELQLDTSMASNKLEVMQKLQQYLLQKHAQNRQVVVFVEEAQSMPLETLEEIRLLSNLETDNSKLLQMVLFGQPELDEKLALPQIRQLKERITHSFVLDPFPPRDTLEYLNFRLRAVGYRGPDIFGEKTAKAVKGISGGLTRRINIIADKALMAAYSEGVHQVTMKHINTAAIDSDFKRAFNYRPWLLAATACVSLALAVWLGTLIAEHRPAPAEQVATASVAPKAVAVNDNQPAATLPVEDMPATDLLGQRLDHTGQWLQTAADSQYSIQLFMASTADADALESFLQNAPESLDFEKIYIYETSINGSPMYSVLYNEYASRQTARSKLQSLPADLQASKPYLRRVSALRKDLAQNG
ncbi:MAG: AAA family ATPase [Gammaproteobacteria bacterium]